MKTASPRASPRLAPICLLLFLSASLVGAENIDPLNNGSQFAWAENIGWINAEPSGDGGPGMHVSDFEVTGYLWGENIGWVSLSCKNDSSCGVTNYGVKHDGHGALSGQAWSENAGWIHFRPATGGGVSINIATGDLSGQAWGENVGWISFASSGANPFKVKTGWSCDPPPPVPSGESSLTLDRAEPHSSAVLLSWTAATGATGYDVVRGDLGRLRSNPPNPRNFQDSTETCLANDRTGNSLSDSGSPVVGGGLWFLVRGVNCGGHGTYGMYHNRPADPEPRDTYIDASANSCP